MDEELEEAARGADNPVLYSIAVSVKRIADMLEGVISDNGTTLDIRVWMADDALGHDFVNDIMKGIRNAE